MQTFAFLFKKLITLVQKSIVYSSDYGMMRCLLIVMISACFSSKVLVVRECTVTADKGSSVMQVSCLNTKIVGCIIARRFYRAVSGSYRINNIAGGKIPSQVK